MSLKTSGWAPHIACCIALFAFVHLTGGFIWGNFWVSFLIAVKVILIFTASAYVFGLFSEPTIYCSSTMELDAPAELVWSVISDFDNLASWYEGIDKTEKISISPEVWRLHLHVGIPMFVKILRRDPFTEFDAEEFLYSHVPNTPGQDNGFYCKLVFRRTLREENGKTQLSCAMEITEKRPITRYMNIFFGFPQRAITQYNQKILARVRALSAPVSQPI